MNEHDHTREDGTPPSGKRVFEVTPGTSRHWLVLPETIRGIWVAFAAALALAVAAEFVVDYHLKFHADRIPAFAAILGLGGCLLLALGAKVLGIFLKRAEDYYDG